MSYKIEKGVLTIEDKGNTIHKVKLSRIEYTTCLPITTDNTSPLGNETDKYDIIIWLYSSSIHHIRDISKKEVDDFNNELWQSIEYK